MGTFLKVFGVVSLLAVAVVAGMMLLAPAATGYSPSDNVLSAQEIAKNPYKFKGMSGIVNPAGIHFSNMAGDKIAIFGMNFFYNDDQLAVVVEDNEPPHTNRWWRVYVEGADDFTNDLGAASNVAEVRFEGYAEPPADATLPFQPGTQQPPLTSSTPSNQSSTVETEPGSISSDGTQPPAPIERQEPAAR